MTNRPRWQTERRTKPELGYNNNPTASTTSTTTSRLEDGSSRGIDASVGASSMHETSVASGDAELSTGTDPNVNLSIQRRPRRTLLTVTLADELAEPQNNDYRGDDDDDSSSSDEERPGAYAITREDAGAANLEWDPTEHQPAVEAADPSEMTQVTENEDDIKKFENSMMTAKTKVQLHQTTTAASIHAERMLKERRCHVALALFIVLTTGAVVGAFVAMSERGKNETTAVTPNQPTTTVDGDCDFSKLPVGKQIDFALQCKCTSRVEQVIDSVAASYQSILEDEDLLQWLESDITIESCSTENLALLWTAADDAEAKEGGIVYSSEAIRNRFGLALLYLAWDGKAWNGSANWMTAAPECVWLGVNCDTDGHIVSLSLPNNMIVGRLEDSKLGLLESLEVLDLSLNDFEFGSLPVDLFALPNIVSLNLTSCKLVGSISELDSVEETLSLSRLETLVLGSNMLTGTIPTGFERATALQTLVLNFNAWSGPLPALASMSNLKTISLGDSFLEGSIPDSWGNLNRLETLILPRMSFVNGELPSSFRNLTNLKHLDLKQSTFQGMLPDFLGDMSSLEYFSGGGGSFSGSIPTTVGLLTNLVVFEFVESSLSGSIPSEFGNCTRLETLALGSNAITGTLPSEIGTLSSLRSLDVGYTSVAGTVAFEFSRLSNLEVLDLRGTAITGTLPSGICGSGLSTDVLAETGRFDDCSCCSSAPQEN